MTTTEAHMDSVDGLRFRVGGLEKGFAELRTEMNASFNLQRTDTQMALAAMRSDNEKHLHGITGAIHSLQTSFTAREKTNWPTLIAMGGLMVTIMTLMGGLLYRPIQINQDKLETSLERMDKDMVPRAEHIERWRAYDRFQDNIGKVLEQLVPRQELQERWKVNEAFKDEIKKRLEHLEQDRLDQARRGR